MKKTMGSGIAGLLLLVMLAAGPPALASSRSDARKAGPAAPMVQASGACSGASTWVLTLKYDNGKVESDWEVQSNAPGQLWKYRMTDNGIKFASGQKVSQGDGSWSVTRYATNQPGSDTVMVTSLNTVTGESCTGSATL